MGEREIEFLRLLVDYFTLGKKDTFLLEYVIVNFPSDYEIHDVSNFVSVYDETDFCKFFLENIGRKVIQPFGIDFTITKNRIEDLYQHVQYDQLMIHNGVREALFFYGENLAE